MKNLMKTSALWLDQIQGDVVIPPVDSVPDEVDVAIVGAGYTGLNAARVLAQHGTKVAVLDRNAVGWGASSRNGGLATAGIKRDIKKIFKEYGKDLGREFWKASIDAIDLVEEIVKAEAIDCHWERSGNVALAAKPSHFEGMKSKAKWLKEQLDYDVTPLDSSEVRSEIGTDGYYGGLLDEKGGSLHPAKYVHGLARSVAQGGTQICENTDVLGISRSGSRFEVRTNKGVLKAKEVIIATNGYTDRLVPKLKPKVFPVGSYIIVTEPLDEDLQKRISPHGRMFYDSKWFLNYFRLTPDGRMLWGGRNDLSVDLDLAESTNILRGQMTRIFPELASTPITHTWTGQLGLTFDLMPHIGREEDGIHYAFGYGGHGVSISTYVGTEIGLLLAGKKDKSPFMEIKHQTLFFYRNKLWFLPLAAQYFRILDAIS